MYGNSVLARCVGLWFAKKDAALRPQLMKYLVGENIRVHLGFREEDGIVFIHARGAEASLTKLE
jgi:hypothetical protein